MKILSEICSVLRNQEPALLATIVAASGSTPAPADSKMLVRLDFADTVAKTDDAVAPRRTSGTIGGGCLDASIIDIADSTPHAFPANVFTFQLTDDLGDTGLNCGGTVDVLVEPINPKSLLTYEAAVSILESGESCIFVTGISAEGFPGKTVCRLSGDCVAGDSLPDALMAMLREGISEPGPHSDPVRRIEIEDREYVIEVCTARPRVIIFGGGHVGRSTGRSAALAGFQVTIVDDRPAYANKDRFPEADTIICEPFDQVFNWLNITPDQYVVIVTRGHKHDTQVLEQVLRFAPKYIGMIGSKRKVITTFEHMKGQGHSPERLAEIHAPIGLDIGAVTPDEIGIAVAAELVGVRRGRSGTSGFAGNLRMKRS